MKDGVRDAYRQCFTTPAGRATLGQLLIDASYFDVTTKTTEELAVLNFVKTILKECGFYPYDPKDADTVKEYVQKLFEISLKE